MKIDKHHDKFLFNYLAKDAKNASDIVEAGNGFVVPGITAANCESVDDGVKMVLDFKEITDVVSVGLGDQGNPNNWSKVLHIAAGSSPGHINQPFERAAFSLGYLQTLKKEQIVNALVMPTGEVGRVQLAQSHLVLKVEEFVELAVSMGIHSIKFMPLNGTVHLEELIKLTEIASKYGIKGVEPAGGITPDNIVDILEGVKHIDIEFFMPHIFGSAIDPVTGNTSVEIVQYIYQEVEKLR